MAWLLVNDNMPDVKDGLAVSVVPIPAAAFMCAPTLLDFAALRRKEKKLSNLNIQVTLNKKWP
jgi:hypothetical protein